MSDLTSLTTFAAISLNKLKLLLLFLLESVILAAADLLSLLVNELDCLFKMLVGGGRGRKGDVELELELEQSGPAKKEELTTPLAASLGLVRGETGERGDPLVLR